MAKLHLDVLSRQDSVSSLRQQLNLLPENLDSIYEETLSRILGPQNPRRLRTKQLLSYINTGTRHLTHAEMRIALSITPGNAAIDPEDFCYLEDIVASCAGVVIVEPESQLVRFVHATFQEYIARKGASLGLDVDTDLSALCLTYLQMPCFESGKCITDEAMLHRLNNHQFFQYAASSWCSHLQKSTLAHQSDTSRVVRLLNNDGFRSALVQAMFLPSGRFKGFSRTYPSATPPLWLASYCKLDPVCLQLLEKGSPIDETASDGSTALCAASIVGSVNTVRLLLKSSAVAQTGRDRFPLLEAAKYGHEDVVRELLAWGASPFQATRHGRTALHAAVAGDFTNIAQALLDREPDINTYSDNTRWTPVHVASTSGALRALKLLVQVSSSSINLQTFDGESPLHCAAEHGHFLIAEFLLEAGASPLLPDRFGQTPLHIAASHDNPEILRLLLRASPIAADEAINAKDHGGQTSLHKAARTGAAAAFKSLVSQGADCQLVDHRGRTPLNLAAMNKHSEIIVQLSSSDAGLTSQGSIGERQRILPSAAGTDVTRQKRQLQAPGFIIIESPTKEDNEAKFITSEYSPRAIKRVKDELADMIKYPPGGLAGSLSVKSPLDWEITLAGPEGSDYSGGFFDIGVNFPDMYPEDPPNIYFITKIYHTNIHETGHISLNIFHSHPDFVRTGGPPKPNYTSEVSSMPNMPGSLGDKCNWHPGRPVIMCMRSFDPLSLEVHSISLTLHRYIKHTRPSCTPGWLPINISKRSTVSTQSGTISSDCKRMD